MRNRLRNGRDPSLGQHIFFYTRLMSRSFCSPAGMMVSFSQSTRACHELLSDLCFEYNVAVATEIEKMLNEVEAPDDGRCTRFTCDMLCAAACADVCDCERSLHHVHETSEYVRGG